MEGKLQAKDAPDFIETLEGDDSAWLVVVASRPFEEPMHWSSLPVSQMDELVIPFLSYADRVRHVVLD